MTTFIEEGVEAGEPVMVATINEHADWLRDGLGAQADRVHFVDMAKLGQNPARIIPAWQEFLNAHGDRRTPLRGIGEPIWAGRTTEEIAECQLHEALLNVAVDPEIPFWLVCPYDTTRLESSVIDEAHRSHPVIMATSGHHGSAQYGGRAHVDTLFGGDLTEIQGELVQVPFGPKNLHRLFAFVELEVYVDGMAADRAAEFARAVHQLAADSVQRGALDAVIRIWRYHREIVCEISDETQLANPLAGRVRPAGGAVDGLWLANQVCDLVRLRSHEAGTTVRLHAWV